MVLVKGAGPDARRFYEFLQQPPALAVFRKYGFEAPGKPD
jgi:molybdate transport system substrate-binding protein